MNKLSKIAKSTLLLSAVAANLLVFNHVQAGTVFPIATNSTVEFSLRSAFDGTNFLVAIQGDFVTNVPPRRFHLEVQRLSQTGALLGPKITLGLTDSEPVVAFDGTNYLVISELMDAGAADGIYGQFVSSLGNPVGPSFMISHGTGTRNPDAVVYGKTNYLVIWTDGRREVAAEEPGDHDIYAQRVSTTGQLLGGELKISGAAGKNSAVAFDGTNHLVIWNEDVNDTDIYGRLINPVGGFVTGEFVIDGNLLPSDSPNNGVIFDGTNYLVAFNDEDAGQGTEGWNLFGKFVTMTGNVLANRVTIADAPGDQVVPSLAFDGSNYLISWSDFGTTSSNIKFKFFNLAGQPMSSEFTVFSVQATNFPINGGISFDGKQFVAIGNVAAFNTNSQVTACDVYGAFISPLPRGTFPIGITSGNEFSLSAGFDGTNYLAGIQGGSVVHDAISAQLFSGNGALVGPRVSTGRFGGLPRVAFDGANYLMVWEDAANNPNDDIYGQFISRSGALVRTPFVIGSASGYQSLDSLNHIVFDGSNYLVVWRDERNGHLECDVYGQLVTPAGNLLGSEIPVATDASMQVEPSAGFDGTNFFVGYQNRRSGSPELYDTYGKFVSRAGVAGTAFPISQNPSPRHNPIAIAFDGANYLVVWNRDVGPGFPSPTDWDIYARLVTRSGSFVGNEFAITTAPGSQPFFGSALYDGTAFLVSWLDEPTASLKNRYYNRSGVPLTSEFSLFGSQGTRFPIGGFLFDGSRLVALASYVDSNFSNGDVYGLILPSPRLSFTAPVANGQIPIQFAAIPGVNYTVQASTNLLSTDTAWTALLTTNSLSGSINYTETNAASIGRRFYRAVQQ